MDNEKSNPEELDALEQAIKDASESLGFGSKKNKSSDKNSDKVDKVANQVQEDPEKLKLRVEELTDSLRRLQAEFENFKKRRDKEEQERMVYHDARMIEQLLPIIDTFESALKHVREVSADEKLINGVELIFGQLFSALEKQGLRSMDVVNKPFDPYKADALMQEKTAPEKDNIVLEELQKGYMFKDRVLRHAKVKVGVADKSE